MAGPRVFRGMGRGNSCTIPGLKYHHSSGAPRGILHGDATNQAPVGLHEKRGFKPPRARHAYRRSPEGDPS